MSNPDSNNQCPLCGHSRKHPDGRCKATNCPCYHGNTGTKDATHNIEFQSWDMGSVKRALVDLVQRVEALEALSPDTKVTRFEVIDHREDGEGRVFVARPVRVQLMYQDDGKTLKVRITDRGSDESAAS